MHRLLAEEVRSKSFKETDLIENMTFNECLHRLNISVYVVNKGTDLESLFLSLLELSCEVYDVIMSDRTINETVDTLDITEFSHDEEGARDERDFFQVSRMNLIVEFHFNPECQN